MTAGNSGVSNANPKIHPRLIIGDQRLRGSGTGVSTYSDLLARALRQTEWPFLTIDSDLPALPTPRLVRWARAARPGRRMATRTDAAILARDVFREAQVYFDIWRRPMEIACEGPPGIVHWTYPVPLRLADWKNVYTFHDVIPLDRPDLTPIAAGRYGRMLRGLVASADRIVTVSAASRRDIERHFDPPPGFVVDLGEAVGTAGDSAVSLPAGLVRGAYFLHCGTIEPRKNIARLIEAWQASGAQLPLILAGPAGWRSGPILAQAMHAGVIYLGYQPRDALLSLIAGARALLMPSLAEGFGLPVAEAMALGTPVMTSRDGALAETAGGAALIVDPGDTADMAVALRRLAGDHLLCERLSAAGRSRAVAFGLPEFGRRLTAFYEELVRDG